MEEEANKLRVEVSERLAQYNGKLRLQEDPGALGPRIIQYFERSKLSRKEVAQNLGLRIDQLNYLFSRLGEPIPRKSRKATLKKIGEIAGPSRIELRHPKGVSIFLRSVEEAKAMVLALISC